MNDHDSSRIKAFERWYINFDAFTEARNAIENSLLLFKKTAVATHLLIVGESGTGKSTLCENIHQAYPKKSDRDGDRIEVLMVSMPPASSLGGIADAMLMGLGDPAAKRGTLNQKIDRIILLSRTCHVRMIILDEAQHLYDRGNIATHYKIGDWFKHLINDLGVPTILVGLPRVEEILRINDQLRRRFSSRYQLELGRSGKSVEHECLQIFLSLAQAAKVQISMDPYSPRDMSERIYCATDGRIAYMKKIIMATLVLMIRGLQGPVTVGVLESVFTKEIWWDAVGPLNPFNPKFQFRRLDRKGEPFEHTAIHAKR